MSNIKLSKPATEEMVALYRSDLSSFTQLAFRTLNPGKKYIHNWHVDVICDRLERCMRGEIKRLIINMPPRMLKSTCASVAFPAFVLGHDPSKQVMCVSYGDELVREFGTHTKNLMLSPFYQALFPDVNLGLRSSVAKLNMVKNGGYRLGASAGGAITGRGADFIIIDDPLKASDAKTKERTRINDWYAENCYQRLNNKNEGVIIVVMQRLHDDDLTGHLLSLEEDWEVLTLPAIAEDNEVFSLSNGQKYTRSRGGVLHPQLESEEKLLQFKQNHGSYIFAAQYQQQPASDNEALVKKDWFPSYWSHEKPEKFRFIMQSWDTAQKEDERADYSVGITFGVNKGQYYILDVFRKKLDFPELLKAVKEKKKEFNAKFVVVEEAASGHAIIASLKREFIPFRSFRPRGDKFIRLAAVSGMLEAGQVLVPKVAPWLDDFILEVTRFPSSKNDDQVDALSQGLRWIQENTNSMFMYDNL